VWAIASLALLLLGLSLAAAPDRRRTIIALALGVVAGLAMTMLLARRLETALLEQIVNVDGRHAVQQAYGELASNLRTITVLVAVAAIAISIVAYLAGRPARVAAAGQRWTHLTTATHGGSELDRWIAARVDLLRLAGIAVALATVFVIGLELLPVLGVGALLGLYLWALTMARQRTAAVQPIAPDRAAGPAEITLLGEDVMVPAEPGPEEP
jgi:hypothetical protein